MSKVYSLITQKIIEKLEDGIIPWHQPWAGGKSRNLITGHKYRGINTLMTCTDAFWMTYKQAQSIGANVKSGEKGTPIVYWSFGKNENKETGEEKSFAFCKTYSVFNVSQIENLPDKLLQKIENETSRSKFETILAADEVIKSYKSCPSIEHGGSRACYSPFFDKISMPEKNSFDSPEFYYSVLFHEMTHSTGHESRLNRKSLTEVAGFGSHEYSKEELVAEIGAAYLANNSGILNPDLLNNSTAYIQSWLKKLRGDSKFVVDASQQAQKAVDLILNKKPN